MLVSLPPPIQEPTSSRHLVILYSFFPVELFSPNTTSAWPSASSWLRSSSHSFTAKTIRLISWCKNLTSLSPNLRTPPHHLRWVTPWPALCPLQPVSLPGKDRILFFTYSYYVLQSNSSPNSSFGEQYNTICSSQRKVSKGNQKALLSWL